MFVTLKTYSELAPTPVFAGVVLLAVQLLP